MAVQISENGIPSTGSSGDRLIETVKSSSETEPM